MSTIFVWQRELLATRDLTKDLRLTGLRVALDSSQTTGVSVVINAPQVASDMGCSERTVWRRVQALIEAGWLAQTVKPTYGGGDVRGRRARYALVVPGSGGALSYDSGPVDVASDGPGVECQSMQGDDTRRSDSSDTAPPEVANDEPSRLTNQRQSCAKPPPETASFIPFGSNAAAAAAEVDSDQLPGPIAILASKLAAHGPLRGLRWDTLGPDRRRRVEQLLEIHGDQPLIDYAVATCRNPAPVFAQAFLVGWEAMPAPGTRLAVVRRRCSTHDVDLTPAGVCRSCESDRKAEGR